MCVYTHFIENSIESIKKLLELINEFIRAEEYKISTEKSVVVLYTNNEDSKVKLRKQYRGTWVAQPLSICLWLGS